MITNKAKYKNLSDVDLIDLLKSGDIAAFNQIYDRYNGLLYVFTFKLTEDYDEAKDIVQELFMYLWDKKTEIEIRSSFSSYLYGAVRNNFLKRVAHNKVKTNYAERFLNSMQEGIDSTADYITEKEYAREIEKHISSLPEKMAKIFILSKFKHLSNKEIAEEMNLAEKTVKNIMTQAVRSLRIKLGPTLSMMLLLF